MLKSAKVARVQNDYRFTFEYSRLQMDVSDLEHRLEELLSELKPLLLPLNGATAIELTPLEIDKRNRLRHEQDQILKALKEAERDIKELMSRTKPVFSQQRRAV